MKNKKPAVLLFILTALMLIGFTSCNEYNEPASIFQAGKQYPASPVIQTVTPASPMVAGVREIVVTGSNFSPIADSNWIFIGGQRAMIKSVSPTQIVIHRPAVSGTGLALKIEVPATLNAAVVNNYSIDVPITQFADLSLAPRAMFAMDLDKDGNMWMASRQWIYKLSADGFTNTTYMNNTDFLRDRRYVEFYDVKVGPDGFVYLLVKNRPEIYRIDPVTPAAPETYATLPNSTARMDFNSNGDIYTGQANGLSLVRATDKSITPVGDYGSSVSVVDLRVISGSVYVMDSTTLYRSPINADGTLGAKQVVYSIANSTNISSCTMSSFTMAQDGTIYLCVKKHPQYSIWVLEADGSVTPFYTDTIIPNGVDEIIWGNSRTMVLSRGRTGATAETRLLKLGMDKNGMPYLGRP